MEKGADLREATEKDVKNVIVGLDPIIYFFVIQRFTKVLIFFSHKLNELCCSRIHWNVLFPGDYGSCSQFRFKRNYFNSRKGFNHICFYT